MKTSILKTVFFLTLTAFSVSSCKKDTSPNTLDGSWIETTNRTDTIVFGGDVPEAMFNLKLGFELRNGHRLPKYGSGLYLYELKGDSIGLRVIHSSMSGLKNYWFKNAGGRLYIGDFYSQNGGGRIRTFKKIK